MTLILEAASSGHSINCCFWYFHIGFIFQPQRLSLGVRCVITQSNIDLLTCRVFFFFSFSFLLRNWYTSNYLTIFSPIHCIIYPLVICSVSAAPNLRTTDLTTSGRLTQSPAPISILHCRETLTNKSELLVEPQGQ